jgi:hypothetical protein
MISQQFLGFNNLSSVEVTIDCRPAKKAVSSSSALFCFLFKSQDVNIHKKGRVMMAPPFISDYLFPAREFLPITLIKPLSSRSLGSLKQ